MWKPEDLAMGRADDHCLAVPWTAIGFDFDFSKGGAVVTVSAVAEHMPAAAAYRSQGRRVHDEVYCSRFGPERYMTDVERVADCRLLHRSRPEAHGRKEASGPDHHTFC